MDKHELIKEKLRLELRRMLCLAFLNFYNSSNVLFSLIEFIYSMECFPNGKVVTVIKCNELMLAGFGQMCRHLGP